jgi:integrase
MSFGMAAYQGSNRPGVHDDLIAKWLGHTSLKMTANTRTSALSIEKM